MRSSCRALLMVPKSRLVTKGGRAFAIRAPKPWNSLPEDIRHATTVSSFKVSYPVDHPPLTIDSSTVERVSSTKFLGVHITEDLTWTTNTKSVSKKAQQRLHFLRRLKRASLPPPILTTFYRGTIESVLTSCITVWYGNCCAADRKTLQRTVNTAAKIIGAPLPSILDIFLTRCSSKAKSIVEDPTHPSHSLFQLLPSGRRYRSIRDCSTAFFPRLWEPWTSHHPSLKPQTTPPHPHHITGKNC